MNRFRRLKYFVDAQSNSQIGSVVAQGFLSGIHNVSMKFQATATEFYQSLDRESGSVLGIKHDLREFIDAER